MITSAMRAHRTTPVTQAAAAEALALICLEEESELAGGDENHPRILARQTDAVPLCISAMLAYGDQHVEMMKRGCMALSVIVGRSSDLRQQAIQLGARPEWLSLLD